VTFSLIGSVVDVITTVMTTIGLPGLLALMVVSMIGVAPIPAEVILPFAGFLVANGTFAFGWALTAALAGTMIGAYAAYAVGLWWRDRITGLGIGHLRHEARTLERMDRFFARRGEITVALLRLVPVVRTYISYPAGTARMEPFRFGVYTLAGAIPYTVALIYAGMLLRSNWVLLSSYLQLFDVPVLVLVLAVVAYLVLQIVGVLEPGWPPRRTRSPRSRTPSGGAPAGPPPSSP
jgi:membrane protein DedA with SNARE-associated domain